MHGDITNCIFGYPIFFSVSYCLFNSQDCCCEIFFSDPIACIYIDWINLFSYYYFSSGSCNIYLLLMWFFLYLMALNSFYVLGSYFLNDLVCFSRENYFTLDIPLTLLCLKHPIFVIKLLYLLCFLSKKLYMLFIVFWSRLS